MKLRLLTFNETKEFLRINKGTLHKLIHSGEIPASRVGKLWRIDKEELINSLKKQKIPYSPSSFLDKSSETC